MENFTIQNYMGEAFDILTNEQAGQVIKAVFAYINGQELPVMSIEAKLVFYCIAPRYRQR